MSVPNPNANFVSKHWFGFVTKFGSRHTVVDFFLIGFPTSSSFLPSRFDKFASFHLSSKVIRQRPKSPFFWKQVIKSVFAVDSMALSNKIAASLI